MRVLFVDDEPRILEAIERTLFQLDVDWEARFAESGPAALLELERAPFDVIVSDMRMPGMDGAELLAQVCDRYPHVARIVLSGQTDESAALRAVHVAHQFLAKPCTACSLQQVVERTRELREWLSEERLQGAVGRIDRLPSAPHLFTELTKALADDATSSETIAAIVRQDPAMSTKVLQVVNSSFFSSSSSVSDVRAAVVRLGMKTIRNLALGIGAFEAVGKTCHCPDFSIDALQARSLATAQLASRIARGREDPDAAFMAGLVCDVGELVLATAMERAPESRIGLPHTPADGASHAEVGAFLLGLWGLPFPIVEAVANHHTPERNAHDRLGLPQIVWVAGCLVQGIEPDLEYLRRINADELLPRFKEMLTS